MTEPYLPEFWRRALDLVNFGRTVRDVTQSLGTAESCLYRWRSQDEIDRGIGQSSPAVVESADLARAKQREV